MAVAGQGVEPGGDHRREQQHGSQRPDEEADGGEGDGRLGEGSHPAWWGLVAEPAQHLQGDEGGQGAGELADEILDAVVDALLAAPGLQFIPFDDIREHGVRQDVRGGDAQPGQEGHPENEGDLTGLDEEDAQLDPGPEDHADDVGAVFSQAVGEPRPEGQRQPRLSPAGGQRLPTRWAG